MMARMPTWVRRSLVGLLGVVGFLVLVETATSALFVVSSRTHWRPGLEFMRWYNKKIYNPVALKLQRKQLTAVHHTGRKSGKEYVTPVWAERIGEAFFIHLPYGTNVYWCRNVLTTGGSVLEHGGVHYDTVSPMIIPAAEAIPLLPTKMQKADRMLDVESYLRLDISPTQKPVKKTG